MQPIPHPRLQRGTPNTGARRGGWRQAGLLQGLWDRAQKGWHKELLGAHLEEGRRETEIEMEDGGYERRQERGKQ